MVYIMGISWGYTMGIVFNNGDSNDNDNIIMGI